MSKIIEYEVASAFDAEDVLLKDGENGTMIISVENAASEFKRLGGIDEDMAGITQTVTQAMSTIDSNIAGVETDYIASKDYAIGDLFIVNNVLYKATAAIAEEDVIDTEINCAVVNLGDEIGDIRSELANKANIDGAYEGLTAGNAEQLIGTVFTEDDAAYTFRTSGGSADIGDREYDEIVGGSVVWNQLIQNGNFADGTEGWRVENAGATLSVVDGIAIVTLNTTSPNAYTPALHQAVPSALNHIYFIDVDVMPSKADALYFGGGITASVFDRRRNIEADVWNSVKIVVKATSVTDNNVLFSYLGFVSPVAAGVTEGDTLKFRKIRVHDLTQMFGSEIADYIYNLERTTPGAGVAWFRKYFPKDYYEYNPGELMHVNDLQSHDMVGFNAWDEEWEVGAYSGTTGEKTTNTTNMRCKNAIPVKPDTAYYIGSPYTMYVFEYSADGTYLGYTTVLNSTMTTKSNAHFLRFYLLAGYGTTYKNDICINLSWSGWRDGEYEPYVKHSYPLDSSLTLRGIPKLSTDGKLYYDGDHYKSDGTVERRYGIVDLGTLEWAYQESFVRFTATTSLPQKALSISANLICAIYEGNTKAYNDRDRTDKIICTNGNGNGLLVRDSSYTDATSFKTAMSGVYLVYELAEPTTEEAQPFQSPQIVDDFGTEEYVTSSIVPVGHVTKYAPNLRDKLQHLPDLADSDGYYMISQTGHDMDLIRFRIPQAPTTDGVYILKATVSGGTPTYTWVDENATETETTEP